MKTLKRLACMAVVVGMVIFLWAPSGMATTIVQTGSIGSDPDTLTFDYFNALGWTAGIDTTGGTLTGVTIGFDFSLTKHIFELESTVPAIGNLSYTWTADLTGTPEVPGAVASLSATTVTPFTFTGAALYYPKVTMLVPRQPALLAI
ncbi:MAG: hypothetical protein Q7J01_02050 [Syntrophales bacterium]|nr:hypothetical protein [Syntrophales bacterium]